MTHRTSWTSRRIGRSFRACSSSSRCCLSTTWATASATRSTLAALATSSVRRSRILPRPFYERPTTVVARDLLGKVLHYESTSGTKAARIVETEAYLADDPASHAYGGPRGRNLPLYGRPGHAYVYISHGVWPCMNVVARSAGRPAGGVLIRGAEPLVGFEDPRMLAGPGIIGRAFGITTALSGADLLRSVLTVRDGGPVPSRHVGRSPRIGLSPGATFDRPWRFYVRGSAGVSGSPRR